MGLFKLNAKNKCEIFEKLENFECDIDELLISKSFISKRMYKSICDEIASTINDIKVMESQHILVEWTKKNKVNYSKLKAIINKFDNIDNLVEKHNNEYIEFALENNKEYLDNILKDDDPNIKLDREQRIVVLSDEDHTLVVAGAGAGKTTTIEAKVKYLVEKQGIDPLDILIVSFTKKATDELKERINGKLKVPAIISTFHSIGFSLIKNNDEQKYKIVWQGYMFNIIKKYLQEQLDDTSLINKITLFFASYLTIPFDSDEIEILKKSLNDDNITTLRQDIVESIDKYKAKLEHSRKTINDEKVKSLEEVKIANFLFINGIDYEYEPVYKYGFKDTIKPYCPDFIIRQGNKEAYLEHFGITESGKSNKFTSEELCTYKQHINDKVKLHREHNTKLLYTFSSYNDGKDLIHHLEQILEKEGFELNRKTDKEIYKRIVENAEEKYFNKLIQLICTFINRFKTNNFKPSKFDEWKISQIDERTKLFLDICYKCYLAYEQALKNEYAIDFEDMINNASDILDNMYSNGEILPFKYIFVDEYQDISMQRFDLCEKLSKVSNAKIIAVGDDWQSIYRFSGAKVDLFTNFSKFMGYAQMLKITKTYRNSQELINIAGSFVMENNNQIKKDLKSPKQIKDPVVLMSYDDTPLYQIQDRSKNAGPLYNMATAIEEAIEEIVLRYGEEKSILLIGRYGFEPRLLGKITDVFTVTEDLRIKCNKFPKMKLTYLTAHSSKGLGYDNVIIINGKDDTLGFPSKIEDDPIMKLVIKDDEDMEYAEERRLFYVALTRTKNQVYIITPQRKPSIFIREIKDKFKNIVLNGKELSPKNIYDYRRACPICGYPLQIRAGRNLLKEETSKIYVCSNDPEICGFITNDLTGKNLSICKCPSCVDGYLIVKKNKVSNEGKIRVFLGCNNYKTDKTGCNFVMDEKEYTLDRNEIDIKFFGKGVTIENAKIDNKPISLITKTMFNLIVDVPTFRKGYVFSIASLADFITGTQSNSILSFGLEKLAYFGLIDQRYKLAIMKYLDYLASEKILKIDQSNFNHIEIVTNPTDEQIIEAYRSIIKYL